MTRSTLPTATAVALTLATALALTACGSDSKPSNEISGIPTTAATTAPATPSATPGDSVKRPPTDLPSDLKMVFTWPKTGDSARDSVLNDGEQYIRAIKRASAKNDLKDPAYAFYSRNEGLVYAHNQVKANIDGGWAPTGDDRYYEAKADVFKAGSATLTFCRDQSKVFSKKVKTGEVVRSPANDKSYVLYNLLLVKDGSSNGVWQTSKITVLEGALQCKG
ncbi:hypothetical protein QMK19_22395 [Streptomyces sp. H10-C2]|uniref:hypothetical protein n=1 Tax=unclassified Streptomyces TaxID=2593676 RepID=UPI0024BB58AC|nr:MULTISPECIES: hypothetical protein [unclassified Streptomyces]MDJ0342487.1 hypothetical protein [Streptomyces sp. PH10-H1]MDJ0372342.1 hypothetical protein [Streptomyces sp. H10-C2]